jgi:hypothetical protein
MSRSLKLLGLDPCRFDDARYDFGLASYKALSLRLERSSDETLIAFLASTDYLPNLYHKESSMSIKGRCRGGTSSGGRMVATVQFLIYKATQNSLWTLPFRRPEEEEGNTACLISLMCRLRHASSPSRAEG